MGHLFPMTDLLGDEGRDGSLDLIPARRGEIKGRHLEGPVLEWKVIDLTGLAECTGRLQDLP